MTLEEAQQQIIELTEQNNQLKNDNETLSQNNSSLNEELERVRTINQDYFNRLMQQKDNLDDGDEEEEDTPSCEDFAKTLNI